MGKNNKQSHKISTTPNKSGYHGDEIKKVSYKVNSDQYKDMDFNFSVNTKYLCKEAECPKKCPNCCSLYSSQDLMAIFEKLDEYRGWKWRKIERQDNGTSSGVMSVGDLPNKKIQDMIYSHFAKLKFNEQIYKIEFNNKRRIWAIAQGASIG